MKAVNDSKIAELLAIPLHVERPHDTIRGVTIGELGGPLYEFVQLIVKVLNETGTILASSGYPNLGAFVAETLKDSSRGPTQPDANVDFVLERVCALFFEAKCVSLMLFRSYSSFAPFPPFKICQKSMDKVKPTFDPRLSYGY
jgi:hypothetical protein